MAYVIPAPHAPATPVTNTPGADKTIYGGGSTNGVRIAPNSTAQANKGSSGSDVAQPDQQFAGVWRAINPSGN